jgi:alkylhydroperoxidase/carboxymuconolactone decarboxylase family protein YurZ/limonene-1,2-epoxide hydrolase/catechol 2,3-dioxygenase-like lactoylglutathione lyase family enzyme
MRVYKNAVLDDKELQNNLKQLNPKFGDFVTRVAGQVWGLPLIDQKTKALITIAVDVANQSHRGSGNPFGAHIDMALKQGASRAEIEELLLFLCVYTGFNKVASCFATLNLIFDNNALRTAPMLAENGKAKKIDYSGRDQKGKFAFYVLLWKRQGISLELFDNYWKDVHGPVCARLPGQHQYWQFHLSHNEGGFCSKIDGLDYTSNSEDNFDGIAELTFQNEAERQTWFKSAGILMNDEHNVFRKAIGYNTNAGNSTTYVDKIADGTPNGKTGVIKFHVMLKKAYGVNLETFREYLKTDFAPQIANNDSVVKFRLHLFEEVDNSRPDAAGVSHYESSEKQYHAAYEIAFANHMEREKFFASSEYAVAIKDIAKYVKQFQAFPERTAYTFVYDGKMTLAGQRSAKVADLISNIGATNQIKDDVVSLMIGGQINHFDTKVITHDKPSQINLVDSSLGNLLQGVQHVGVTVSDMAKSVEFYTQVLGGKLVVEESELVGDIIQNTLFQKEELDALSQGINSNRLNIPRLRSGNEDALDVKFISFGNTVVELLFVREAGNKSAVHSSVGSNPSHVGHVNAMHISFNVKEGIDLNLFAKMLEEESQKRGMTNVVCNRTIHVKSEAERKAVALKHNSFKFWNEPNSLADNESANDWSHDPMEGWSLFYCKGPNGEQLEFNQVTRQVKNKFKEAMQQYNRTNGTSFTFPETQVSQNNNYQNVQNNYSSSVSDTNGKANGKVSRHEEQFPGKNTDLVKRLFSRGEAFDSEGFITFFTDKPVYQFGNFDVCLDKQSIKKSADNFFSQIDAVYHEIKMMWEIGNAVFVEMDVLYWRKDGSMISLPCCDIFRVEGDKFSELRIFMDVNPVFNPHIPVPKSASILTGSEGKVIIPPGTMRKHFAEHPEAQERIKQGYVPKWSLTGARWSIGGDQEVNNKSSEQFQSVGELSQAVMAQNWNKVKNYLTDDILYKVGSSDAVYGPQQVVEFFQNTFRNIAVFTGHKVRKVWQEPDIITIEMDAYYEMVSSKKRVTISCCDIYRMRGNRVSEWRVYADMSPWSNAH